MTRFPDPHRSRAVLIGASRYHGEGDLPEIPAVRANLTDLEDALVGVSTGTLASRSCAVVGEPTSVADVGNIITAACVEATDLLLMYYAGHGLVDERGRLHLALSSTDPCLLRWTALPFETLREEIASSPASTRVLILDCCFSGRAIDTMSATQSVITGQIDITGTYTLTSTTANALSYAPQGAKYTAFTGALLTLLNTPGALTLDELFRRVDQSLAIQGAPRPQRRVVNAAGDLVLFKATNTHPHPAQEQRPHERPLSASEAVSDTEDRKIALANLAGAMQAKLGQAAALFTARAAQIASPSAADDTTDTHQVPTNEPGTTTTTTVPQAETRKDDTPYRAQILKPERRASPVAGAPGKSLSDTDTPSAPDPNPATPNRAKLTITNLGPPSLDALVDGTVMATLPPGEIQTLSLTAGTPTLQFKDDDGRSSAPWRVTLNPGTMKSLTFNPQGEGPTGGPALVKVKRKFNGQIFHFGLSEISRMVAWLTGGLLMITIFINVMINVDYRAIVFLPLSFLFFYSAAWSVVSKTSLVLSNEGIAFGKPYPDTAPVEPIPWANFDQFSLFGDGKNTRLVVWHKEEASHRLPGKTRYGSTEVCIGKNIGMASSHDSHKLRSALKRFAGDVYVE